MIHLESNTLELQGQTHPIKEWVVWFRTIEGICTTREEALQSAERCGMPPELVMPVPVAIDAADNYEVASK